MEAQQNKFAFFANFAESIRQLPEELQPKAYQAICEFGIYGILPEDAMLRGMCLMAKASIQKIDGRSNNGGNHNPAGINQHNKEVKEVNSGQFGQSGQILSETETETETETEVRNKKQEIKTQSSDKSSDCVARKKLVPIDWFPKLETVDKLSAKGLDTEKVVERFINSCRAKNLKYVDFDRAILAWDWSKDTSVQKEKCWF